MKALTSAVTAGSLLLLGSDVAYASGAGYLLGVQLKYWIGLIALLALLNLLCCWRRR